MTDELKREREFYRVRGLPCPKDTALADKPGADDLDQPDHSDCHRKDEQVLPHPHTYIFHLQDFL